MQQPTCNPKEHKHQIRPRDDGSHAPPRSRRPTRAALRLPDTPLFLHLPSALPRISPPTPLIPTINTRALLVLLFDVVKHGPPAIRHMTGREDRTARHHLSIKNTSFPDADSDEI